VQQFDNIFQKEITKRYINMNYTVYQKEIIERDIGSDRPFKP